MKYIDHPFVWTNRSRWAWPSDDVKLLQVINDVNDVEAIIKKYVNVNRPDYGLRTCIQAGAACGIWPYRLSLMFDRVITCEPLDENFECATLNLASRDNVKLAQGVLGSGQEGGMVGMKQHPNERNNAGSQQVELDFNEEVSTYPVFTIDGLVDDDDAVDFIALDLEGYELQALKGAAEILESDHPVVMVEDKGLSTKFGVRKGAVVDYLRNFGYSVAETIKRDVILV